MAPIDEHAPRMLSDKVPLLRPDLSIEPKKGSTGLFEVGCRGEGRTFTLYDFEVSIARMLNGRRSVSELIDAAGRIGIPVSLESFQKFARQLEIYGFLVPAEASASEAAGGPWVPREEWKPEVRELFQTALRTFRKDRASEARGYVEALLQIQPEVPEAMELLARIDERIHAGTAAPVLPDFDALHKDPELAVGAAHAVETPAMSTSGVSGLEAGGGGTTPGPAAGEDWDAVTAPSARRAEGTADWDATTAPSAARLAAQGDGAGGDAKWAGSAPSSARTHAGRPAASLLGGAARDASGAGSASLPALDEAAAAASGLGGRFVSHAPDPDAAAVRSSPLPELDDAAAAASGAGGSSASQSFGSNAVAGPASRLDLNDAGAGTGGAGGSSASHSFGSTASAAGHASPLELNDAGAAASGAGGSSASQSGEPTASAAAPASLPEVESAGAAAPLLPPSDSSAPAQPAERGPPLMPVEPAVAQGAAAEGAPRKGARWPTLLAAGLLVAALMGALAFPVKVGVSAAAELSPLNELSHVTAPFDGKVAALPAAPGEWLEAGAVVLVYDDAALKEEQVALERDIETFKREVERETKRGNSPAARRAKAALKKKQLELDRLTAAHERLAAKAAENARAKKALAAMEKKLKKKQAELEKAQLIAARTDSSEDVAALRAKSEAAAQQLADVMNRLGALRVTATEIGVFSTTVRPGEQVKKGEVVAQLVDTRTLRARLSIPADRAGCLAEGQTVSIRLGAGAGEPISTRLAKVERRDGPMWSAEATIENSARRLPQQSSGIAEIDCGTRPLVTRLFAK